MPRHYIERILKARVYDVARETPLDPARRLSERLGQHVFIKREDLQPVFSFKIRGAYNRIVSLSETERRRGIICASAGNHAQGVAISAQKLGIRAVIVMPKTTPSIKVEAVRSYGGEAVLHGDSYDEASDLAHKIEVDEGMTYIPPYDDPDVIAGQGTIAMELLRQHPEPIHAVFVPVGGGGLIAGIAAYIKTLYPDFVDESGTRVPQIRVVGVEPEDSACLWAAMQAGRPVDIGEVGLFADGVAVRQIGDEPFRIAVTEGCVDEVIRVDSDELCASIRDIFDDTRSIAEPAGALAVAGLKKYAEGQSESGLHLIAIDSGANMNFDRLRHVAERAEIGENREAVLAVTIPEEPGSLQNFCDVLENHSITEFNYRYGDAREAHIFVGIGLSGGNQARKELIECLDSAGLPVVDLTWNELAKLHTRFMVGGRSDVADERVFRVEFPERPGALTKFLKASGSRWNISLFHYRNHGAAYGRVLIGMQVPEAEIEEMRTFLDGLEGYRSEEETDNEAYRIFLRSAPFVGE